MIKNILWDFDGVILDSMKIKGDGFAELFKDYDRTKIDLLEQYHYKNGGISRFEKIRHFFNNILNLSIDEEEVLRLADDFASIIEKKLFDKSNLISESIEFIESNHKKYNFHIVSGAEHDELNTLCEHFGIDKYFISINGSPTGKDRLIKNILEKYNYKIEETILIGDSINDHKAAKSNDIVFYGFNNIELKNISNYIDTLAGCRF